MQLYCHLSPFLALSTNAHARMMILPEVSINWSFQGWGKLVCNRSQESFYALFDNGVWESLWWCLCGCTVDKNRDGHPYAIAHDVIISTWWEKFSHKTGIFCQQRYRVRQYHCRALKNSIPSRNNNEKITLAPPSNYLCKMVPAYHKWGWVFSQFQIYARYRNNLSYTLPLNHKPKCFKHCEDLKFI